MTYGTHLSSSSLSFSRSAPCASSAAPPQSHPAAASLADAVLTLPGRGAVARRATPATREEEPELAQRPWRARARFGWGGRGQRRELAPRVRRALEERGRPPGSRGPASRGGLERRRRVVQPGCVRTSAGRERSVGEKSR